MRDEFVRYALVSRERRYTAALIAHLAEISRRKPASARVPRRGKGEPVVPGSSIDSRKRGERRRTPRAGRGQDERGSEGDRRRNLPETNGRALDQTKAGHWERRRPACIFFFFFFFSSSSSGGEERAGSDGRCRVLGGVLRRSGDRAGNGEHRGGASRGLQHPLRGRAEGRACSPSSSSPTMWWSWPPNASSPTACGITRPTTP